MFEDSTFESTGRIRTRSRGWMIAALGLNSAILLLLVLVPLLYPEALPLHSLATLIAVPAASTPTPAVSAHRAMRAASGPSMPVPDPLAPPRMDRSRIFSSMDPVPGPAINVDIAELGGGGTPGGIGVALPSQPPPRVIHPASTGPVRISSLTAASIAIDHALPVYPAIAKIAGVQGTVVLAATISKSGTVENLRVVSGHPMLQQAALDAVRSWRYHPYLLNGEPVAVETTVNVVFSLQR